MEKTLKLGVNLTKSRTAPLRACAFLGFQLGARGKVEWTAKALERCKRRVKEITHRSRGHRVQEVITELRRYVLGWMNYFGTSHTYKVVLELDKWCGGGCGSTIGKRGKAPRMRRRHLLTLGINPEEVRMASRSRKGYWRLSGNGLVQRALSKHWLGEQGVPELRSLWIALHYSEGPPAPADALS